MAAHSFGGRVSRADAVAPSRKKVGLGLGLGILFLPYVFSWFVLRPGYSNSARILSLGWCLILVTTIYSAQYGEGVRTPSSQQSQASAGKVAQQPKLPDSDSSNQVEAAAPDGEPTVVAQSVIRASFDSDQCPLVIDARRFGDGTIRAMCSNGTVFRVLTFGNTPIAINCAAAVKFGVAGC